MRRVLAMTAFGLLLSGVAAAQMGARALFDGKSLDNWMRVGDANWTITDGALQATQASGISHLVSKEQFGDFELSLEVWMEAAKTNSGIFIRCQDPKAPGLKTCYEVNLWDGRPEQNFATGGIVDVAEVITPVKVAGRWATMVITAKGPRLMVAVDGTKTAEGEHSQHARGHISLQYAGPGTLRFRNVQIRPL